MPIFFTPSPPETPYLPSKNYNLPIPFSQYEWDNYGVDIAAKNTADEVKAIEQLNILNKVAADIIENSVDVDPEIANFIDEEFWDLI